MASGNNDGGNRFMDFVWGVMIILAALIILRDF